MISPKALLFLALQQYIDTFMTDEDEPKKIFPYIDRDMAQLDNGSRPPVSWPCTLIRIVEGNFRLETDKARVGVRTVILRIGFPPLSSSNISTPAKYRNKALEFYELEQIMYQKLHGWRPNTVIIEPEGVNPAVQADISNIFGAMECIQDMEEDREDFITVARLVFTISHDDNSAVEDIVFTPVTPAINTELDLSV